MAELTVTVPTSKLPVIRAMVKDRLGNDTLADEQIIEWIEGMFGQKLQLLCGEYQRKQLLEDTYTFDDPLTE